MIATNVLLLITSSMCLILSFCLFWVTSKEKPKNENVLRDYYNVDSVGIQISAHEKKIWVCVNGQCVLRVKGIEKLELFDDRPT